MNAMTTSKTKLTPTQKKILAAIEAGGGHAHLKMSGPDAVTIGTLLAMWKRGLISYRASGGWAAVCRFQDEAREPRQHILESDLARVVAALKAAPGWRCDGAWELLNRVNRDLTGGAMGYQALCDAVRFGSRTGVLWTGDGFDYSLGQDYSVEVVAGN